ncbi:MAG TPA: hypothetical protein VI753_03740, partial [Anaerolineales bacterium]|nr:hypothetical protein [Anaerolineales bacterium]
QRVQHAVAGAAANHEVICEGGDVLDVQKQDVFALFVLQGGDDFMCKFECVQLSPLLWYVIASRSVAKQSPIGRGLLPKGSQ